MAAPPGQNGLSSAHCTAPPIKLPLKRPFPQEMRCFSEVLLAFSNPQKKREAEASRFSFLHACVESGRGTHTALVHIQIREQTHRGRQVHPQGVEGLCGIHEQELLVKTGQCQQLQVQQATAA